jgi:hypothetical protein
MYEYRILFPRLGAREIRRELNEGPRSEGDPRTDGDRRRASGAYRPERPGRRERA